MGTAGRSQYPLPARLTAEPPDDPSAWAHRRDEEAGSALRGVIEVGRMGRGSEWILSSIIPLMGWRLRPLRGRCEVDARVVRVAGYVVPTKQSLTSGREKSRLQNRVRISCRIGYKKYANSGDASSRSTAPEWLPRLWQGVQARASKDRDCMGPILALRQITPRGRGCHGGHRGVTGMRPEWEVGRLRQTICLR